MCIVIDAELFSSITGKSDKKYKDYKPVVDWVVYGKGKVVYGGSKYAREVMRHGRFSTFIAELRRMSKTVVIDKKDVDFSHKFLERSFRGKKYNDHHILAIVVVSGCKLICSVDKGLHSLVKECYSTESRKTIINGCPNPGTLRKPSIYQNGEHKKLLCDSNIAQCCKN